MQILYTESDLASFASAYIFHNLAENLSKLWIFFFLILI